MPRPHSMKTVATEGFFCVCFLTKHLNSFFLFFFFTSNLQSFPSGLNALRWIPLDHSHVVQREPHRTNSTLIPVLLRGYKPSSKDGIAHFHGPQMNLSGREK